MVRRGDAAAMKIVRFLASMPVAIGLLSLLAITSSIGTALLQNRSEDFYLSKLGPTWYRILDALGFFDMYRAWWFITILVLLVLSVGAALLRHGPRFWHQFRPLRAMRPWPVKHDGGFRLSGAEGTTLDAVEQMLRRDGFRESLRDEQKQTLLMRRGRHSKLGFFLVHGSVILICIGVLVTAELGFRGTMNIPQGAEESIVYIPDGRDFRRIQLPFSVVNDKFDIDFYHTGMPSEYSSELRLVTDEGEVLANKRITVNDPLRYKGITFYQSNFGDAGSEVSFTLYDLTSPGFPRQQVDTAVERVLEDDTGIRLTIKELRQHNVVNVAESANDPPIMQDIGPSLDILFQSPVSGNITYTVYRAYPHMVAFARMGEEEMTYDAIGFSPADNEMMALLARYMDNLREQPQPIGPEQRRAAFGLALAQQEIPAERAPQLGPIIDGAATVLSTYQLPMLFSFDGFEAHMYTGLQVARDPGSPLVWTGSALLVLGLALMFYVRDYRVWVRIGETGQLELCALQHGKDKHPVAGLLERLQGRFVQDFGGEIQQLKGDHV